MNTQSFPARSVVVGYAYYRGQNLRAVSSISLRTFAFDQALPDSFGVQKDDRLMNDLISVIVQNELIRDINLSRSGEWIEIVSCSEKLRSNMVLHSDELQKVASLPAEESRPL